MLGLSIRKIHETADNGRSNIPPEFFRIGKELSEIVISKEDDELKQRNDFVKLKGLIGEAMKMKNQSLIRYGLTRLIQLIYLTGGYYVQYSDVESETTFYVADHYEDISAAARSNNKVSLSYKGLIELIYDFSTNTMDIIPGVNADDQLKSFLIDFQQ